MLTRRQFLTRAGGAGAAALLSGCATRSVRTATPSPTTATVTPAPAPPESAVSAVVQFLPSPDFSQERVLRCVAGVRPYREGGIRLEAERVRDRVLVHNYGHGGGGITLAPGCAERVVGMVRETARPGRDIAVIGAGVNGLMCARLLQQAGYGVSIYTDRMPAETTSHVAGGQWAPAGVSLDGPGFDAICRRSFALYEELIGEEFGVFRRPNYVTGGGGGGFSNLPLGVLPPAESLDRLPFEGPARSGRVYQTLLVEPPRLLARVSDEAFASSVRVERRRFASAEELVDLDESVVVNCMGLGAREVVGDSAVYPVRGQLVHLAPQELPYLLSHRGYIFPRSDAVILGGTYERGVDSTATDERTCERLLRLNAGFFG